MFGWIKKLFGSDVPNTPEIAKSAKVETKKTPAKKAPAKKASTDLESMSKNDLLAHAKANSVKVNSSMKKADIITAIKNG